MLKRTFDILFSGFLLMGLSPLLVAIALSIKLTSKGNVIFTQERIGKDKKPFHMYKFRTMVEGAEESGPQLAVPDDPRVTKTGKILRRYHLDELTQFWNVLKGDMSVVGPRPEREVYIKEILKKSPEYARLSEVKPGITSLGMVKYGYASDVDQMVERSKYDLYYLDNKSASLEMKIIADTILTVFKGKGL